MYEYDSENRVTKNQYTNNEKKVTINSYEYDSRGNKISERSENSVDESTLTLYAYNEKGERYLTKRDSDGDGNFERITTNSYNQSGVKIQERIEEDGIITSEIFYTDNGKFKESRTANSLRKYIYDENGNKLSLIQKYSGIDTRTDYIYNDSGELIKEVDENGEVLYSVEFKN